MRAWAVLVVPACVAAAAGLFACSQLLQIPDVPDAVDSGSEGAAEAGCADPTTADSCGACGVACAPVSLAVEARSCDAGTCAYACASGHLDCNAGIGTNTDGCECAAPSCCGTSCAVRHDDGLGTDASVFFDCVEAGVYNVGLAEDACRHFTGSAAACTSGSCDPPSPPTDLAVCSSGSSTDCVCWTYAGPDKGLVFDSQEAGACLCALPGNPPFQ